MDLIALLITKEDDAILREWCEDQLDLYDAVVCLDGSSADDSERILRHARQPQFRTARYRDFAIPYKTDHCAPYGLLATFRPVIAGRIRRLRY